MTTKRSSSYKKDVRKMQVEKKAAVMGPGKKKLLPILLGSSCAFIMIALGAVFFTESGGNSNAVADGKKVVYPLNSFDDGTARHFQYKTESGLTVKYFVVKSSDGIVRAAFDACDVCWPSGKGYYQEGDAMVCRNCGRRFATTRVNEVKGGCNPAPLKREVVNGKLVINRADILEGERYFDFSKRS